MGQLVEAQDLVNKFFLKEKKEFFSIEQQKKLK